MGLFNTVLKSVAKKAAVAALLVVGKQVISKAIGNAIDKRKTEDAAVGEEVQATAQTNPQATPAASDAPVKAKPVRKSRAKAKPAADSVVAPVKKPAASRSKPKPAATSTTTAARKPRAPRKPKVAANTESTPVAVPPAETASES